MFNEFWHVGAQVSECGMNGVLVFCPAKTGDRHSINGKCPAVILVIVRDKVIGTVFGQGQSYQVLKQQQKPQSFDRSIYVPSADARRTCMKIYTYWVKNT